MLPSLPAWTIVKPSVVTDTLQKYNMESTYHHYCRQNILFIL